MTSDRTKALRRAAFALAVLVHVEWIRAVAKAPDLEETLRRDWVAFEGAGRLLLQGRAAEAYASTFDGGYFFFYPPFALYPCALFGAISSTILGYALSLWLAALSLAGALALLARMLPARREVHWTIAGFTLASAAWVGVFVTGQVSALLVLVLAAAGLAWTRGKPVRAGMILALLGAKPNLGLPLVALVALSGRWRVFLGLSAGFAVLLASTLPLGSEVWAGWWAAMRARGGTIAAEDTLLWKQPTLFALWHDLLPAVPAWLAWGLVSLVLFGALVRSWRARRKEEDLPRLLSATVLFLVACNPHLLFYDGLLLVLPAAVWAARRESYASPGAWRACGALLSSVYFGQHLSLLWLQERTPPVIGALVAAWLTVEMWDLSRGTPGEPCPRERSSP